MTCLSSCLLFIFIYEWGMNDDKLAKTFWHYKLLKLMFGLLCEVLVENVFTCSIVLLRSICITEDVKVWQLQAVVLNLGGVKSRDGNLVDLSPRLVCYRSDESRATLSAQQGSTEYPVSVNTASVEPFNPILGAQYFALGEVEHVEGKKNGHPCFIWGLPSDATLTLHQHLEVLMGPTCSRSTNRKAKVQLEMRVFSVGTALPSASSRWMRVYCSDISFGPQGATDWTLATYVLFLFSLQRFNWLFLSGRRWGGGPCPRAELCWWCKRCSSSEGRHWAKELLQGTAEWRSSSYRGRVINCTFVFSVCVWFKNTPGRPF